MAALHLPQLEPAEQPASADPVWPSVVVPLRTGGLRRISRETRERRRRLVVLVGASLLVVTFVALAQSVVATEGPSEPLILEPLASVDGGTTYVVQSGDTLWTVARRMAPDIDPRPLVAELRERNGGSALQVGDRIELSGLSG